MVINGSFSLPPVLHGGKCGRRPVLGCFTATISKRLLRRPFRMLRRERLKGQRAKERGGDDGTGAG
jgi:hypothetical protein